MIITKQPTEKTRKVKGKEIFPATDHASVTVRKAPNGSSTQYGSIEKPSIVQTLASELSEAFKTDGLTFSNADAEKVLSAYRKTFNHALHTAHAVAHGSDLSTVNIWTPMSSNAIVSRKPDQKVFDMNLLQSATAFKNGLIEEGMSAEDAAENEDYKQLLVAYNASAKTANNDGKSEIKFKKSVIDAAGVTPIDASASRAPIGKN
jgi:hypothetical protein